MERPTASPPQRPAITRMLLAWSDGDQEALADLMAVVCDELRRMAQIHLLREVDDPCVRPSDLVQDFFLKIHGRRTVNWDNREHFFGFAAQTMRLILIDHARSRGRQKRGEGEKPISLDQRLEALIVADDPMDPADFFALHQALDRLEAEDPEAALVVKMRFFLGMTNDETAEALEIPLIRVKRNWSFAQRWLARELDT